MNFNLNDNQPIWFDEYSQYDNQYADAGETEGPRVSILDLIDIPFGYKMDYDERKEPKIKYHKEKKMYCYCLNHDTYIYMKHMEFKDRKELFQVYKNKLLFKKVKDEKTGKETLIGKKDKSGENPKYENIKAYEDSISKNPNSDPYKEEFDPINKEIKIYDSIEEYFNGKCSICLKEEMRTTGCRDCQNIGKYFYRKINNIVYDENKEKYYCCLDFKNYFRTYIYLTKEEYDNFYKQYEIINRKILLKKDGNDVLLPFEGRNIEGLKKYKSSESYISENKEYNKIEFDDSETKIKVYENTEDYFKGKCKIFKDNHEYNYYIDHNECVNNYKNCENIMNYYYDKKHNIKYDEKEKKHYYCLDFKKYPNKNSNGYFRTIIYLTDKEYKNREKLFETKNDEILFENSDYSIISRGINGKTKYENTDDFYFKNRDANKREFNGSNTEIKVYESVDDYFNGKCKIFKDEEDYNNDVYIECENISNYYYDKKYNIKYDKNKKQHCYCLDFKKYPNKNSGGYFRTCIYLTDEEYKNRQKLFEPQDNKILFELQCNKILFEDNNYGIISRGTNGKTKYKCVNDFYSENKNAHEREFEISNTEIKVYKSVDDYFNGRCKIFKDEEDYNNDVYIECENIADYYYNKYNPINNYDENDENRHFYSLDYLNSNKSFRTYIYLTKEEFENRMNLFEIKNQQTLFKKCGNKLYGRGNNKPQIYENYKDYCEKNENLEFNPQNKELKIYESTDDYFRGKCKIFKNEKDYLTHKKNAYCEECNDIAKYYKDKFNFNFDYNLKNANFLFEENIKPFTKEKISKYKNYLEEYLKKLYIPSEYEITQNQEIPSEKINYFEKIFIPYTEKIYNLIKNLEQYRVEDKKLIKINMLNIINILSLIFKDVFFQKEQSCYSNHNENLKELKVIISDIFKEYFIHLNINDENDENLNEFKNLILNLLKKYLTNLNDEKESNMKNEIIKKEIYKELENFVIPKNNEEYSKDDINTILDALMGKLKKFIEQNNTEKFIFSHKNYLEYDRKDLKKLEKCFSKLYQITENKLKNNQYSSFNDIYNEILNKLKLENIVKSNGVLAISKIYNERSGFKNVELREKDPQNCLIKYDERNKEYIYILPFGNIIHITEEEYKDKNFNIDEKFKFNYKEYYLGEIKEYKSLKDIQDKKCLLYKNILSFKKNEYTICEDIDKEYKTKRIDCDKKNYKAITKIIQMYKKNIFEKLNHSNNWLKQIIEKIKNVHESKKNDKPLSMYPEIEYELKKLLYLFEKDILSDFEKTEKKIELIDNYDVKNKEIKKNFETFKTSFQEKKYIMLERLNNLSEFFDYKNCKDFLIKFYKITNGEINNPIKYKNFYDKFYYYVKEKKKYENDEFYYCAGNDEFFYYAEEEKRYELEKQTFKDQFEIYYKKFMNFIIPEEIKSPEILINFLNNNFINDLSSLIDSKNFLQDALNDYIEKIKNIKQYISQDGYSRKDEDHIEKFSKQLEENEKTKISIIKNITNTYLSDMHDVFDKILLMLNDIFRNSILTKENILNYNIKNLYNLKYNFKNNIISKYYKRTDQKKIYEETFAKIRLIHKYREVAEYIKIFEEKLNNFNKKIDEIYDNFKNKEKNYSEKIKDFKNDFIPIFYTIYSYSFLFDTEELQKQYKRDILDSPNKRISNSIYVKDQDIEKYFDMKIKKIKNLHNDVKTNLSEKIEYITKIIYDNMNSEDSKILKDKNAISNLLDLKGILIYFENTTNKNIFECENFKKLYEFLFNTTENKIFNNTEFKTKDMEDINNPTIYNEITFPEKENKNHKIEKFEKIEKETLKIIRCKIEEKKFEEIKKEIFEKIKHYEEYIENFYNFDFSNSKLLEKMLKQTSYLKNELFTTEDIIEIYSDNGKDIIDIEIDESLEKNTAYKIFLRSFYKKNDIERMYKLFYYIDNCLEKHYKKYKRSEKVSIDIELIKNLILNLKKNIKNKLNYVLKDITKTIDELKKSDIIPKNTKNFYNQKYELILKKLNIIKDYDEFIENIPEKDIANFYLNDFILNMIYQQL